MSTPIGPYRPIVQSRTMVGHLGPAGPGACLGRGTGHRIRPVLVEGGAAAQLTQALDNAGRLLADHGASPADVVKTTVFVTDMGGYAAVNEAYVGFFGDHRPARSVVGVAGLPMGAAVEVEVWAYLDR